MRGHRNILRLVLTVSVLLVTLQGAFAQSDLPWAQVYKVDSIDRDSMTLTERIYAEEVGASLSNPQQRAITGTLADIGGWGSLVNTALSLFLKPKKAKHDSELEIEAIIKLSDTEIEMRIRHERFLKWDQKGRKGKCRKCINSLEYRDKIRRLSKVQTSK